MIFPRSLVCYHSGSLAVSRASHWPQILCAVFVVGHAGFQGLTSIHTLLFFLSGFVSITTLTVLAYERYIRVVHARVINFSWAWRAITYIWLYSLAWAGAPLLGWNRYILDVHGLGCTVDWKSKDANDSSFVLFLFLGCLVVPMGIIAHCYGHILYSVRMVS